MLSRIYHSDRRYDSIGFYRRSNPLDTLSHKYPNQGNNWCCGTSNCIDCIQLDCIRDRAKCSFGRVDLHHSWRNLWGSPKDSYSYRNSNRCWDCRSSIVWRIDRSSGKVQYIFNMYFLYCFSSNLEDSLIDTINYRDMYYWCMICTWCSCYKKNRVLRKDCTWDK